MRFPLRPIQGRWFAGLESRFARFFRINPDRLLDPAVTDEQFRLAMSSIYVGDTIKITGANRHPAADDLLLDHVDASGRTIVDIGASDGSTSVDLVSRLGDFASYVIADLYLTVSVASVGSHRVFLDPNGTCILVSGRRLIAWPSLSRTVRALYAPFIRAAQRQTADTVELALLNPATRRLLHDDPRVSTAVHDVFEVWSRGRPDVIKIANLLRRLYFSDADILRALAAVHASLADDGVLLIVDNPRIEGMGPRGGLYRRAQNGFDVVAETEDVPEINDLVRTVRTDTRTA